MNNSQSRKTIIEAIREGLQKKSTIAPFPDLSTETVVIPVPQTDDISMLFAEKFAASGGNFVYCEDQSDFFRQLQEMTAFYKWEYIHCWEPSIAEPLMNSGLKQIRTGKRLDLAHASLSTCEALVADTGSILFSSANSDQQELLMVPPVQIVLASYSQLVLNMEELMECLDEVFENGMPSYMELVSGPAKTRAIEMREQSGGMAPRQIHLFFIDDATLVP